MARVPQVIKKALMPLCLWMAVSAPPAGATEPGAPFPAERDYYSPDGRYLLGVTPGGDHADACSAELLTVENGRLRLVWRRKLANRIAPAEVLVANDGTVVTLDNWEAVGIGESVLTILPRDEGGGVRLGLEQILTEEEIARTVHQTASSRWWRTADGAAIDAKGREVLIATTAGLRGVSLKGGSIRAAADAPPLRSAAGPAVQRLEAGRYQVSGRLECMADCANRHNWFLYLRPGLRFPQRLRLEIPSTAVAERHRGRNVTAVVRVHAPMPLHSVRGALDSIQPGGRIGIRELYDSPIKPLTR